MSPQNNKIVRDRSEIILEIIAALGLIIGGLAIAIYWPEIPEKIPGHFDARGIPDRWTDKSSIIFLPIVAVFLYGLLSMIGWLARGLNYKDNHSELKIRQSQMSRKLLVWLKIEIVFLFAFLIWQTIRVARGEAAGLGVWFLPLILVIIFFTAGWHVYKINRGVSLNIPE